MTQAEIYGYVYFLSLALLAGVGVILGLGGMLQVQRHFGRWYAIVTPLLVAAGIATSSLLSGRDLKYAELQIEAIAETPGGGTQLLRLFTAVLVGFGLATLIGRSFARGPGPALPTGAARGRGLLLAFLAYYACNNLINSVFGTVPAFTHNTLYVPVVFAAVFMCRDEPVADFARAAKWGLLALMLLSLLVAVVKPSLAVQPNYQGWVPGLRLRLWGVGSNPNSIGPLALLLLLLEYAYPARRAWLRWLVWLGALAVLVLAQSKTAWAAALMAAGVLTVLRFGRAPGGGVRIGLVLAAVALLSLVVLVLMSGQAERVASRLLSNRASVELSTLSGRLQIWQAAIEAWRDNPLFGYGPTAWGPLHRAALAMPFAFSAHNQFMQSLSVAGGLGLLSLLALLGVLLAGAWRASAATRGVSVALLLVMLARSMTEAPFYVGTLYNGDLLTLLVLFRLVLPAPRPAAARQPAAYASRAAQPARA